ncbi:MAG: response regulator [Anaerolineales bacterium]|nr:response regulator [Anaerolineales bacterium]
MANERILVVDDDEALLRMLVLALKQRGYKVEGVNASTRAVEILRTQEPFSVLLTDLMMPDITGLELLRQAHNIDPHIEVVVITAVGSVETAVSAMRHDGAFDFLLKPLESMSHLGLAIERAANHRRLLLEREEMQARIQADAEWLYALIANTGDAILAADFQNKLTIANPAACRLLGDFDLMGKPALTSLHPALVNLIHNWQISGARHPTVVELPWADGTTQMVNLQPITVKGKQTQGWVIAMRDITHLKNLDEFKNRILINAAQRIRLPLIHAMNALAELKILAGKDERLSGPIYRLTNTWGAIQEWGAGLSTLVEMDAIREVRLADIDLEPILKEAHSWVDHSTFKGDNIQLEITAPTDLPSVRADPALLRQLLQGLIKRSKARSQPGDVIRVGVRTFQHQVWIDVSDNGPEVGEADLLHIFEGSAVEAQSEPLSAGLELTIIKAIMDRMGGQVWIGGQGPVGATISICLPASNPAGEPQA